MTKSRFNSIRSLAITVTNPRLPSSIVASRFWTWSCAQTREGSRMSARCASLESPGQPRRNIVTLLQHYVE